MILTGIIFSQFLQLYLIREKIKKPLGIIAKTIKGKYLDFAENNNNFHHAVMTKNLYNSALIQINNQKTKK